MLFLPACSAEMKTKIRITLHFDLLKKANSATRCCFQRLLYGTRLSALKYCYTIRPTPANLSVNLQDSLTQQSISQVNFMEYQNIIALLKLCCISEKLRCKGIKFEIICSLGVGRQQISLVLFRHQ